MPDAAVETLREWQQYCKDNNIRSEFVFPCTKTGNMRSYTGLRSLLERFKKSNGFQDENLTLYTFRHMFATILLEQLDNFRGENVKLSSRFELPTSSLPRRYA